MIHLDELKSLLWGAAVLLRGKINATGYKEYIFPLVFFKRISDVHLEEYRKALELSGGDEEFAADRENYTFEIPEGCLWNDIREVTENVGQALVTAWTRIEQANPSKVVGDRVVEGLQGIFGKRDHWTNKNLLPDQTLSELIEHFSKLDLSIASCPADEMGQAYEYLVGKFADDAGNTAQEFYTNRTVVELMAEILEPKSGESIYDPTCGTGGMLISCIARCKAKNENWREIKAYGQEQNALTSSVARMNLFLHGVEEFRIINDDTLLRPGFLNAGQLKTFDVVLANPPYSIKQWNRELFSNDPYGRNFLGTPPQGRADYAFIQHILKSMDPKTGRCAILLPHGVLFREEEREIRKVLLDSDLLECVIGLAPNLFYNSPMEACIMICRAAKPAEQKGKVLFINAVNEVTRKNAESRLESTHIEKILSTYAARTSDGAFSAVATREEIAAKKDSLAISLYAHVAAANQKEATSLEDALIDFALSSEETTSELKTLKDAMDGGALVEVSSRPPRPEVIVPSFATSKVKLGEVAEEVRGNWRGETKDVPIVGLEHLDPDEIWLKRWEVNPDENTFSKVFRKGQLLLGRRRVYQKKLSVASCDGICSGDITVIAAKGDKILPELLPFYLRSERFFDYAMQGSAGSLSPRVKWAHLADYEFDLPPIEKQRELAELLWAANDLKESYKKLIVAADEMLKAKFREMFGGGRVPVASLDSLAALWLKGQPFKKDSILKDGKNPCIHYGELFTKYGPVINEVVSLTNESIAKSSVEGDILFPASDVTPDGLSRCSALMQSSVLLGGDIVCLRPKMGNDSKYLSYAINQQREQLLKCVTGGVVKHISAKSIKSVNIPLPSLSLQHEFVAIAELAEKTKIGLKKSIADLEAVIKGLING